MLLYTVLNIQNDEADKKEADNMGGTEEQKKVSPSSYYYIILRTCCSNTYTNALSH
jgi:hypothetical protein